MATLILIMCLGRACTEVQLDATMIECITGNAPGVQAFIAEHPGYRLKNWRCEPKGRPA